MSSFHADISSDVIQIDSLIQQNKQKLEYLDKLLKMVSQQKFENDSILIVFSEMMSFSPFDPNLSTYESIKSGGNLNLISDYKLKEQLIKYYQQFDEKKYIDNLFPDYLNSYLIPFAVDNIDFLKQKWVSIESQKNFRFTNLVFGYRAILSQHIAYHEKVYTLGEFLKNQLSLELNCDTDSIAVSGGISVKNE